MLWTQAAVVAGFRETDCQLDFANPAFCAVRESECDCGESTVHDDEAATIAECPWQIRIDGITFSWVDLVDTYPEARRRDPGF